MRRLLILVVLLGIGPATIGANEVRLTVAEPSGVPRGQWPVTSGIPLAQGALLDDQAVALFDLSGREILLQTETLARWPDGSVRWLLLDFQVDLAAHEKKTLALRYGPGVRRGAVEKPLRVTKGPKGNVVLEPGPVRLEYGSRFGHGEFFPQGRTSLVGLAGGRKSQRSLTCNYPCEIDGVTLRVGKVCFKPQIEEIVVEQAGPLRACLRISGCHTIFDGKKMFRYVARVHAWRGQPYVRVHYTFINDRQDELMAKFDRLRIAFCTPPEDEPWCLLDGKPANDDDTLFEADESHYLRQGKPAGRHPCGWAAEGGKNGGLAVGLREFWQNWPKGMSVDSDGISLDLCPELPRGLYDGKPLKEESKLYYYLRGGQYTFKVGMAKTHEFWIRYLDGKPDTRQLANFFQAAEDPLLAVADPAYVSSTRAMGDVPPANPQKFAGYDAVVSRVFSEHLKRRETEREYGMLNYGDWYGERYVNWGNLEYDLAHGMLVQYLRTGDRRYFLRGEQAARHHVDVDVIHAVNPHLKNPWGRPAPLVDDIWAHSVGHTGGYYDKAPLGIDPGFQMGLTDYGHVWVGGDLEYYYLTGDRRVREVAVQMADAMLRHCPTPYDTHIRGIGWPIVLLLNAFDATGDKRYLDAATVEWQVLKKNLDWKRGWVVHLAEGHCLHPGRTCYGNVPFIEGLTCSALAHYHRITHDPEVLRAISVAIDQMIRECWIEEQKTFRYTACPLTHKTPSGILMAADAMAYEAALTGNREHLRVLREGLGELLRQPDLGFREPIEFGPEFGKHLAQFIHFTPNALRAIEDMPAPAGSIMEGKQQ